MKVRDLLWAMWGCDPDDEVVVQFEVFDERAVVRTAYYQAPTYDVMRDVGGDKQLVVTAATTMRELAEQFPDPTNVREAADYFVREVESPWLEDEWDEEEWDGDDGPGRDDRASAGGMDGGPGRDVSPLAGDEDDGFPF